MARLPKDPAQAVGALGIEGGASVIAVGPDHGYLEALVEAVGSKGKLLVQAPPPDSEAPNGAEIVEMIPEDAKADVVVAWTTVAPPHEARELGSFVGDGGALWLVLPKAARDTRVAVTEGEVKRAMLSAGWREDRVQQLSKDAYAVRFHRRQEQRD